MWGKGINILFFSIDNNGFAMPLCFIAFATDLFFHSWTERVPQDELVLTK
jgi:hypothetical protein